MASDFNPLSEQPADELGQAVIETTDGATTVSLHLQAGSNELWLREESAGVVLLAPLNSMVLTRRSADDRHFILAGSFRRLPADVRTVKVSVAREEQEPIASSEGWICLVPQDVGDRATVWWLRGDGQRYEMVELPPLSDSGSGLATFYGPKRR